MEGTFVVSGHHMVEAVREGVTQTFGWTSDLEESTALSGRYYPERAGPMRLATATARTLSADPSVLQVLIDDLGPWLAAEYTAVHGQKAPRPAS
jgi:hypothetical protein